MTLAVVEPLEVIEVEKDDRASGPEPVEALEERPAVRQAGQGIGTRLDGERADVP